MEDVRYMISEASKKVGVESHTLRYWEEELSLPIDRNEMGHRYYKERDIEQLKVIKDLKEQGFQLKAINMLLPNLNQVERLDDVTMVKLKNELNGKETAMWKDEETSMLDDQEEGTCLLADKVDEEDKQEVDTESNDKMNQFKAIMSQIIVSALKENNIELSRDISDNVTENVSKEMNYLMRVQEEKEEERFRKFDSTLRDYQKSRMHAAASFEARNRKKSKFFKKNKVYI
ncbi:MAG: MerR family transcriptional regulator [Clostridiales bacterium]|nr:MerR family transcriptional regulator [Clostridiales bacterium]